MTLNRLSLTFIFLASIAHSSVAQSVSELRSELNSINQQIEKVDSNIQTYEGGLIKTLAEARMEALELSKTLVENHIRAEEGIAVLAIQLPAVVPNEELAQKLLGELAQQQKAIDVAVAEAEDAGGLIKSIALSRVEAEKLTLSQLQMAYLQAKYGIAIPNLTANPSDDEANAETSQTTVSEGSDATDNDKSSDASNGSKWKFVEDFDSFNDKNSSYVYLEATGYIGSDDPEAVVVRCDAKGGYNIYVIANGYIGARNDMVPVRYRFGQNEAISERWNESTSGSAAFLPSTYNDFRKNLATGEDFVFEITDYGGSRSSSEFDNSKDEKLEFVMGGCK